MKFGASSFIWVSPFSDDCFSQLAHAKGIGFDIYEVAVENPDCINTERLLLESRRVGIQITVCGAFGESRDISSDVLEYRENGIDYIRRLIDMAFTLGSPYVAGPMYAAVGRTRLCSPDEKLRQSGFVVENMKRLADYAGQKDVNLAMEPLNRFETDFMNTVEQGLEIIEKIGASNVGFLLDTFHMNIEEKSIPHAIRAAKGKIFDFHSCANDRGTPGDDHLDWYAIRDALIDAEYNGPLVIESFTDGVQEIARAVSMWRPLAKSQDRLAADGLAHLKSVFA